MDIFDLALAMTRNVGNTTISHLIECFGSAENVFAQSFDQLRVKARLSEGVARAIVAREGFAPAANQIEYCRRHNIAIVAACDDFYPAPLKMIHNAPYIIYVQGNIDILSANTVALVGTRRTTPYGERTCHQLVKQLGERVEDVVIVSGLAFGVDAAAHRAALDCGLPTIAVVPTPLPDVTPAHNRNLANRILAMGGALVSEIPAGVSTARNGFIARNRIIVGLSHCAVIVESAEKGGAMATAQIALSNGRCVGAVPGRISDAASSGCNKLLRNKNVFITTSAEDIVNELGWHDRLLPEPAKCEESSEDLNLSEDELKILKCFIRGERHHISELEVASGMNISQLNSILLSLELSGCISMSAGSQYERLK